MHKAIQFLESELIKIRAGKANPQMLDGLSVDYYGSPMSISQVANVSVLDARTLSIQPWEKNMLQPIERAIIAANMGVTPQNDGVLIRIFLPPLTEERRRDITKVVRGDAENARVAVRNVRRDVLQDVKEAQKEKLISQDEEKKAQEEIQKLTDKHVADIEQALAVKEKEIMQV